MNDSNETAKIVKLKINELPDSDWVKYLADQFLYKKKSRKKRKNGVKFLIYDEYGSKIVDEFVLMWEEQLKNEDLGKYLFDKKGNKIKRGVETFLLYEKNGEITYDEIVMLWESRLEYESSFMYDRNGEKRWGRTKFGIVGEDGRFDQFLTLLLAPEDEEPLWMDDPERIRRKFAVWESVFKSISEKEKLENGKSEKVNQDELGEDRFFKSMVFLNMLGVAFGLMMNVFHKPINNSDDNIKKIQTQTVKTPGHPNNKISDGIIRIPGHANSKHQLGTVKEKKEELTGNEKEILKNETNNNLNEKTTYEISSPTLS